MCHIWTDGHSTNNIPFPYSLWLFCVRAEWHGMTNIKSHGIIFSLSPSPCPFVDSMSSYQLLTTFFIIIFWTNYTLLRITLAYYTQNWPKKYKVDGWFLWAGPLSGVVASSCSLCIQIRFTILATVIVLLAELKGFQVIYTKSGGLIESFCSVR